MENMESDASDRKGGKSAMSNPWITYAAVLFGIAVAVVGVIAYLRMIKVTKNGERRNNKGN